MTWTFSKPGFNSEQIATNGNTFMTGNGYMGYRGTLEEFGKQQLTANTIAGLYDKVGDQWREPVNAPNGLRTVVYCDAQRLSVLESVPESHEQEIDIRRGVHRRETVFHAPGGNRVTLRSERFVSMDRLHMILMKFAVQVEQACELVIETGIDTDVWDINGPHLEELAMTERNGVLLAQAVTHELRKKVAVAEAIVYTGAQEEVNCTEGGIYRTIRLDLEAGETFEFVKYVSVYTDLDSVEDPAEAAVDESMEARQAGYDILLRSHEAQWECSWNASDVRIEGDEQAQLALRYSIYQLLIIAPSHSEKLSIPARGLSGQVYKGAVFWDTEMFMLPFFLYTNPKLARNLMTYRLHTLDGARRKAAEYGYEGAFYAWESQDSGDDACTLFNINDVFTGRPMRTYFRDKQVHISADVAHGMWQIYAFTGDDSILLDGGAEVILECARFFYSYAYYKEDKQRYEILDVTGPDEYHERVNNNAFTNYIVKRTLDIAIAAVDLLQERHPESFTALLDKLDYASTLERIRGMRDALYVPQPDPAAGVIEQFDGYYRLEDVSLAGLKSRMLNKHEYLGGGSGLATTSQILKQADVVLMLHLFKGIFPAKVKKANWAYYEPRTEHGSSLSPCVYALVAADIGLTDWAYPYFMRTATIDMTGDSKQYVGDLYIGVTHPAANGGAWMAAILGFAGIHYEAGVLSMKPALPEHWTSIEFTITLQGQIFDIRVDQEQAVIVSNPGNQSDLTVNIFGGSTVCQAGKKLVVGYARLIPAGAQ